MAPDAGTTLNASQDATPVAPRDTPEGVKTLEEVMGEAEDQASVGGSASGEEASDDGEVKTLEEVMGEVEDKGASAKPAIVLEPLYTTGGFATARFALSGGDIVQLHSGCSEWGGGGAGILVRFSQSESAPPIVEFDAGPARELESGFLLVEERHQFANDGTDEPATPPKGASAPFSTATGSIFVSRLLAVDLDSGEQRRTSWDSFAAATAGAERFVVYAQATEPADIHTPREASSFWLWDLESGRKKQITSAASPPDYRRKGDEVLLQIGTDGEHRYIAVNGSTGKTRDVSEDDWEAASALRSPQKNKLVAPSPDAWQDKQGAKILVPSVHGRRAPSPPTIGYCGVSGPYWRAEFVFTDRGVYHWPKDLELESR